MKSFANVVLNTSTHCLFCEIIHAEHYEQAHRQFWKSHERSNFRLLSVLEVPESTHPEFELNDLRRYENELHNSNHERL